jgi:NhaP-type Na+/H+ and K+/H+ antiporter
VRLAAGPEKAARLAAQALVLKVAWVGVRAAAAVAAAAMPVVAAVVPAAAAPLV